MKATKHHSPPRWAQKVLEWYCRPELLEDLQGDLNEYFQRHCKEYGPRKARLIYIADVFKFFRTYTVRKPEFINLLINFIMLGSYIKTSGRSIVRNKLFSGINIIGLSISMSVGLLTIGMLWDVLSYDKFHDKHDRVYRVISRYEYLGNKDNDWVATSSMKAAKELRESISGPEAVAVLRADFNGDITAGEKTVPLSGFWASETLFDVFSFRLLSGNPVTALKEPFSIVLTETASKKLFGDTDAMGKTISFNKDRTYTVTGIMEDVPTLSHMKFDMLGSLNTRLITEKENKREYLWDNVWNTWIYVLMPKTGGSTETLKHNLAKLAAREDKTVKNTHIELDLQPLDDVMTGENHSNQIGTVLGSTVVWAFVSLSLVVILSACFNYTNLSIARSLSRSREVGIRKTIGALKSHVIMQFIVESVIISLVALVIAFGLFVLIKPHFLSVQRDLQELIILDLSPALIFLFVLFAVFIGFSAGIFPALFFSRINAVQVLKNLSAIPVLKGLTLRKVLIVFQYTLSIMFITATVTIYKQYKHFLAYDLGFSTENILNIELHGNKAELLAKELSELHEVKDISSSLMIMSVGNYWGTNMKNPNDPADSAGVYYNMVDEKYIPLHGIKLIAGRNFNPKTEKAEESEVIVNRQVLKRFEIANQDPQKAIGEVVKIDGKQLQIIGVMDDFEYGRANGRGGREVVLRQFMQEPNYLNVKILSSDWPATYSKIETIWKKIDNVHQLQAKFYDEQLEEAFADLRSSAKVAGFLAFLVVCISSIGLLGMVVFTTETRLKEISIRKVLGASESGLLYLLGKGFFILLATAAAIGLPLTYLFFEKLLFPDIPNHAPLEIDDMLYGVLAVLGIALLMIGLQTLKVARTNPANVLKSE